MSEEANTPPPNVEAFQLRLQAKNEKLEAAESQLAELRAKNAALANDAERAQTYKEQRDAARNDLKTASEKWQVSSAMMSHGITDPDEQDLTTFAWGRLDKEERSRFETVNGWLAHEEGARTHKLLGNLFSDNRGTDDGKRKQPPADDKGKEAPPQSGMDKRKRYYDAMQARNADPTNPTLRAEYAKAAQEYLG